MNNSRSNHKDIPKVVSLNGTSSCNELESAEMFSSYFSSVYSSKVIPCDFESPDIYSFDLPNNVSLSLDDVYQKLSQLHCNKSVGPDGLPGVFLSKLKSIISYPLWILLRRSLDEGIFPHILKLGSITPILKSGCPTDVSNYRPISILSHIAKMFESLVQKDILRPFNNIIMEEQHGFRPGRSTITNNLIFHNYCFNAFQHHSQVDVIYTDFNKAFDTVNHAVLVKILKDCGTGEPLLSWLKSYLDNRYQWVKLPNVKSNVFFTPSGVPQGGHLSPLLFSIFINSLSKTLKHCQVLCFADDIKLFMKINCIEDSLNLQSDLDRFVALFDKLGLSLNLGKCKAMTFTRTRSPLTLSYHIHESIISRCDGFTMDLGFKLSSNLDPGLHIEMACCKALRMLGIIMRLSKDLNLTSSLKVLYCSLVRPIIEYGAIVWDPHTADNACQVERVQRRFLRFTSFLLGIKSPPHDYSPVAIQLNLASLAERRRIMGSKFLNGLLDGSVDSPTLLSLINFKVPQRTTRSITPFHVPFCSTNYLLNEPLRRMTHNANLDPTFSFS